MSKKANISLSFKGKTQSDRLLSALNPNTFQIDDRDSLDLLAFTTKFAKAFKYYNPQNKVDGSWQELLLDDPSMLLAYIIKTNYYMEFPRFLDYKEGILATNDMNTKRLFAQQYFSIGFHVVLRINRWFKLSDKSLSHHDFRDYLYDFIVEEGRQALQDYYLIYFQLCEWVSLCENQSLAKLEALDRVWFFQPFPCIGKRISEITDESLLDSLVMKAVKAGQKLYHLQEEIIKKANTFFEESIKRNDVSPHIGLLLTFLDLFKYQQNDLNKLTESHLDFYFNSILGFKPLPALPDTTHVQLINGKGSQSFVLPGDTSFSAGNDSKGNPIVFSTKKKLSINKSELISYLTLSLNFDNKPRGLLALGTPPSITFGGLYTGTVKKFSTLSSLSWPFFGAANSINPDYIVKEEKEALGFAISCPELILNSGEREIIFTFFNEEFLKLKNPKDQIIDLEGLKTILFNFQLTIATGWQNFEGQCVSIKDDVVKFKLKLLTSDPAIVPYSEKIHKAGLNVKEDWPVCKITLAKGTSISNFEKITDFSFENISINSSVKGAQDLVLQNDRGKLSPKATFYPFGNTPFPEANLFVGGQELFVKPLSSLSLNILWNHLPDNFEAYYEGYPSIYNNECFKANLSFFNSKSQTWETLNIADEKIVDDSSEDSKKDSKKDSEKDSKKENRFSLFTPGKFKSTGKKDSGKDSQNIFSIPAPLFQKRSIRFSVDDIQAQPDLPEILKYSQKQSNAFFKLTLVEPSQGFGTAEYSQLLSKTTLENGQAIIWNAKVCKDTSVCKILEEFYNIESEFEKLEIQFVSEVGKLNKIHFLLENCLEGIFEIFAACQSGLIKKGLIDELLKKYLQEIQEILKTCNINILQIVEEALKIFEDFLIKFISFKIKDNEKSVIKNVDELKGNIDDIFLDLEKILISKTNKDLAAIEEDILEDIKKIIEGALDKLTSGDVKSSIALLLELIKKFLGLKISTDSKNINEFTFQDNKAKIADLFDKLNGKEEEIITAFNEIFKKISDSSFINDLENNVSTLKKEFKSWKKTVFGKVEIYMEGKTSFISIVSGVKNLLNFLLKLKTINYIPLKPLPNKPFVPKIKKLSVDYKSFSQWKPNVEESNTQLNFQFFHLEPFGNKEILNNSSTIKLFPDYKNISYAFLGFTKLNPGETLTILFNITSQVKSMTPSSNSKVNYQYLSLDGWKELNLDADGTYDLEQSGIIQFVVPKDISDQSTLMPKDVFWLRVAEPIDRINKAEIRANFVGIHAVPVQRTIDTQTDLEQIEAGIIKSAIDSTSSVKKIQQPIPSFGGREAETKSQSIQRAAYRLNNKNRAVTLGDIENLILQSFNGLYQAIAVPMRHYNQNENNILKVVTIPFTNSIGDHPYRPLVLPAMMREILEFSKKLCPPSMKLKIVNPDFYFIKVTVMVLFNNQNDIGVLSKELNSDLNFYLSPWLKNNPFDGTQSNVKNLAAFVSSRPYVEKVGALTFSIKDKEDKGNEIPPNKIYPWNLVVPVFEHCIKNMNLMKEMNQNTDNSKVSKNTSCVRT